MSYFKKHVMRSSHCYEQQENTKPPSSVRPKKTFCNAKTQPSQDPHPSRSRPRQSVDTAHGEGRNQRSSVRSKQTQHVQPKQVRAVQERQLPGLMLEGESSMQELLNSSINQFTKYLSDRDPLEEEHQQLVAQNKDLRKTLQKLKMIIKQKLVSALNKQRQELNAVMQDYVQLITKLLADKEELTASLEQLEQKLVQSQQECQTLSKSQADVQGRLEELTKDREQHIAKTKHQIDDFLQIIEQYQEEAEQEGQEGEQLRQKIAELQEQLRQGVKKCDCSKNMNPPKTQALLEMLQRAQQENKMLREHLNEENINQRISAIQREHQQQFMEYERAMKETLSTKDACIARLSSIIQSYRDRRPKDNTSGYVSQVSGYSLE